jgi:hypothetical protein
MGYYEVSSGNTFLMFWDNLWVQGIITTQCILTQKNAVLIRFMAET